MKNSFIVKGFDFYNAYLKARLGLQEELNTDTNKFSGIVFFRLNPENYGKIFNGVSYDAPKTSLIFEEKIYKEEGTVLPNPINWSNERVGYVCLENKESYFKFCMNMALAFFRIRFSSSSCALRFCSSCICLAVSTELSSSLT